MQYGLVAMAWKQSLLFHILNSMTFCDLTAICLSFLFCNEDNKHTYFTALL